MNEECQTDEDNPAEPRAVSGAETVCEHCKRKITSTWHDDTGDSPFACASNPEGGYKHVPRTPETQGERIPDDLKALYREAVRQNSHLPSVAWQKVIELIEHIRRLEGGPLDGHETQGVPIPAEPRWLTLPNEHTWWWHWNGDDSAVPHIYGVLISNTGGPRYFIQYPDGRWCDEIGGWWLKVDFPNLPGRPLDGC